MTRWRTKVIEAGEEALGLDMADVAPEPAPAAAAPEPALRRNLSRPRRPRPVAAASDDDILDLTEMVTDDGSVVQLSAARPQEAAPGPAPTPRPSPPPRAPEPVPDGRTPADAFAQLRQAVRSRQDRPSPVAPAQPRPAPLAGGKTVEQLVTDALRPMLQDWIDNNLESVVERVVAEEVRRISNG